MSKENTPRVRQTFLWERGRTLPDLSSYEQRLTDKLKPLIRKFDEPMIKTEEKQCRVS